MTAPDATIRVLHVDSETESAERAATALERADDRMTVRTATGASEGLKFLARNDVDCVVSGHEMAGRSGLEFLTAVRDDYSDLPFIIFTGEGSEAVAAEAISAGVTDYVRKRNGTDQYAALADRIVRAVDARREKRGDDPDRFRRAMEEAPVGIVITDPDRDDNPITYANRRFRELTGYAEDEILGRNCRFLQGEDTDPEAVTMMREAVDHENRIAVELRNYRKDGTEFWNRVLIAPVRDGDGSVVNYVGFQRDVTERKRQERALAEQNERLEQFANVVSHDLRNPLNVAQGRIELARAEGDSDHLADAADAVDRSLELIDDLLSLAREGERASEVEPVDLRAICERCRQTIDTADATLDIRTDRRLRADPGRLQQLLENLVRNAIEHGGTDPTVTIGDLPGGFYVADDGPGIPPDERDRVFEAGYSTTDEGTGFGLDIVENIVDAHGWEITVTESTDGGSRFEITGAEIADE